MSRKILVGSSVFFNEIEGFQSKDRDYVILVEKPVGYDFVRQTTSSKACIFEWRKMSPERFVEYSLRRGPAMQLGKFLVPEFVQEIGFTIEHLKALKPLAEKLDERHKYEKVIYDSYIENGSFELTEEQRSKAYEQYKLARGL
jgi:hypothetical protein